MPAHTPSDPSVRFVTRTADIAASDWDALRDAEDAPFSRHAFLALLEQSGSVGAASGWHPCHLLLAGDDGRPRGVMPLYLKEHSYGEYVFDWAWAHAYQQHGIDYYPKLVSAIPFTPATTAKMLARDEDARDAMLGGLRRFAEDQPVSSVHALFLPDEEIDILAADGYLVRHDHQFHWHNQDYEDFDHYLSRFTSKKRKNIRAERRKVAEAGVRFRWLRGAEAGAGDWHIMHALYQDTIAQHGGMPYLEAAWFEGLAGAMGDEVALLQGRIGERVVCSALYFLGRSTLYGRYWGAAGFLPGLHFETCYYQPIEFAIGQRMARFEAGAQGLHKLSRGLAPHTTRSAHWLKHPAFYDAVERYLAQERGEQARYTRLLDESLPFRRDR